MVAATSQNRERCDDHVNPSFAVGGFMYSAGILSCVFAGTVALESLGLPRASEPRTTLAEKLRSATTISSRTRTSGSGKGSFHTDTETQPTWRQPGRFGARRHRTPSRTSDKTPNGYATSDRVRRLHGLRNRVAHMENLLDVDIEARHRDVVQPMTAIDGGLYDWPTLPVAY